MRVLVCDDHAMLAASLALYLEDRGHDVQVVTHPADARTMLLSEHFDLCLLDLRFGPDRLAGLNALRGLKSIAPSTAIVMMSGAVGEGVAATAVASGAHAVVDKSLPLASLEALIVAAAARSRPATGRHGSGEVVVPLTRREREVLDLLAEGMSGEEIADALEISKHTVRTHLESARTKLAARNRVEALTASTWSTRACG